MVDRVNGGIISKQMLTGNLRYFIMTGPFAWTVSDGSVNLPPAYSGGNPASTRYHVVADGAPVPNSAAELALKEIAQKATIVVIGLDYVDDDTTEIHFAVENGSCAWDTAADIETAVQALSTVDVYVTSGSIDETNVPVTSNVDLGTVTVAESPFLLAGTPPPPP